MISQKAKIQAGLSSKVRYISPINYNITQHQINNQFSMPSICMLFASLLSHAPSYYQPLQSLFLNLLHQIIPVHSIDIMKLQTHSPYLVASHCHALSFALSKTVSTSRSSSLKTIAFLCCHKAQIIANHIDHHAIVESFPLTLPLFLIVTYKGSHLQRFAFEIYNNNQQEKKQIGVLECVFLK